MNTIDTDKDPPISTDIAININRNTVNSNPKTRNTTRKKRRDDVIPRSPPEPKCEYVNPVKSKKMGKDYDYSICPDGKRDWFYTLFGCFSKLYVCRYDKMYFRKVLCFRYTTDGNRCCGMYAQPDPEKGMGGVYPEEAEVLEPECLFFYALFLRFIRVNICRNEL
jgi:hypothetical protein